MLAPAADQVPAMHVRQSDDVELPVLLFAVPALQRVHAADPALDHDPAAHDRQLVGNVLPAAVAYFPAAQFVQVDDPADE